MATGGDATIYALGISLKDRESAMKPRVLEFAQSAHLQRPYAPQAVQQRKGERLKGFVLIPGFATALLGAMIAWFSTRKSATDTKS